MKKPQLSTFELISKLLFKVDLLRYSDESEKHKRLDDIEKTIKRLSRQLGKLAVPPAAPPPVIKSKSISPLPLPLPD